MKGELYIPERFFCQTQNTFNYLSQLAAIQKLKAHNIVVHAFPVRNRKEATKNCGSFPYQMVKIQ